MALRNPCFKDQIGLIWGKKKRNGKEKEKRRGRERGDQAKIKRYGTLDFVWKLNSSMETTLSRDFVWITWNLRLDMVNILSLNLGFDRIAFSPWIS